MRISDAVSKARDIEVEFDGGAILQVSYRPASYTAAEAERLQIDEDSGKKATPEEKRARITRILEMIGELVSSWNLLDDDDTPIDPTDIETLRAKVPLNVFTEVIRAISEDQRPEGEA